MLVGMSVRIVSSFLTRHYFSLDNKLYNNPCAMPATQQQSVSLLD